MGRTVGSVKSLQHRASKNGRAQRGRPGAVVRRVEPFLKQAADAGVTALVECSTVGVGRNLEVLQALAAATSVHIVAPTGVYRDAYIPGSLLEKSEEELAELMGCRPLQSLGSIVRPQKNHWRAPQPLVPRARLLALVERDRHLQPPRDLNGVDRRTDGAGRFKDFRHDPDALRRIYTGPAVLNLNAPPPPPSGS